MEAIYQPDGTVAVSGTMRIETFNRVWAGIGWPDRDSGYLCVVGERTDGLHHVMAEHRGGLWELGDAAREMRERLLVDCFLVDARDELATAYLRTLDGLCFRDNSPALVAGKSGEICAGPVIGSPSVPEGLAAIVPVPDRVTGNFRSALERVRGMILSNRIIVHEKSCPVLLYTLRQPLDDLVDSPVVKGLVWVVTALTTAMGAGSDPTRGPDSWYGNISRE